MKIRAFSAALALGFLSQLAGMAAAQAAEAPPALQDFFKLPTVSHPVMSPDGRHVAIGMMGPNDHMRLAVLDLQHLDQSKLVAGFDDADVVNYHWVNNDRLVYSVDDRGASLVYFAPGLWAVNRDGTDPRELIDATDTTSSTGTAIVDKRLPWRWRYFRPVRDGSADVIMYSGQWDNIGNFTGLNLVRLDTTTGRSRNLLNDAPAHVSQVLTDPIDGAPVALSTSDKGRYASYLRAGTEWKLWQEGDAFEGSFSVPEFVTPKGDLLVSSRRNSDTEALYSVDHDTLKLSDKPIIKLDGYDFGGAIIFDEQTRRLLGFRYETDASGTAWFDPGMRALQAEVDKLLPATTNTIDCGRCNTGNNVVISSSSDRQPAIYYLYKRDTKELQMIASSRPWIQAKQMGSRDMFRFKARDGLEIPVLVTQPPGKPTGPRPAVMLVHGGPNVRGTHWQWEPWAQFLASRGYVVIEPEFRGSTGYGWQLFRSGWKQWGLAMQDDVEDAMKWAAGKGWVDPQRVCIAGASYGGYATLMGLIKTPDLYKCGFEWAGVSDINLMYSIQWSDTSDVAKQYGMPRLIGDPVEDAQQLKDTSPIVQAARLKRPLLMAYGGRDHRVPMKHGTSFRDAVTAAGNKDVEWVAYATEGHGWREFKNNIDWWTRVEKFLDRNIGPGSLK